MSSTPREPAGTITLNDFIRRLDPTLSVGQWVTIVETEFFWLPGGNPDTSPFCFFYEGKPLSNKLRAADIPQFDPEKLGWGLKGE